MGEYSVGRSIRSSETHFKTHVVGCLVSSRPLNRYSVHPKIKVIWNFVKSLSIEDIDWNTFLFTFPISSNEDRILSQSPWNFRGLHMVLQQWNPDLDLVEIDLDHTNFWLQVHGLSLELMTSLNAEKIGRVLGSLMEINYSTCVDYTSSIRALPKKIS